MRWGRHNIRYHWQIRNSFLTSMIRKTKTEMNDLTTKESESFRKLRKHPTTACFLQKLIWLTFTINQFFAQHFGTGWNWTAKTFSWRLNVSRSFPVVHMLQHGWLGSTQLKVCVTPSHQERCFLQKCRWYSAQFDILQNAATMSKRCRFRSFSPVG